MHNPQILREEAKENIKEDFLEEDIIIFSVHVVLIFVCSTVLGPIYEYMGDFILFCNCLNPCGFAATCVRKRPNCKRGSMSNWFALWGI